MPGPDRPSNGTKDDCADYGLIKVDLLGLGMMAVLEESIHLIREHQNEDVGICRIYLKRRENLRRHSEADTVGMFQIESRAQMACLPRYAPGSFLLILVVQVAIIRPGPIVGKMVIPICSAGKDGKRSPIRIPRLSPCSRARSAFRCFRNNCCA
jgi:error-prone DNA polymerase